MDSIAKILLRKTRASEAGGGRTAASDSSGGVATVKRTARAPAMEVAVRGKAAATKPAAKKPAAKKSARGR